MIPLLFTSLIVVLIYKTFVFFLSLLLKRNDIADVSWGISFILIATAALLFSDRTNQPLLLILVLITIWGIRLAIRIALRNRKKNEDYRYQEMLKGSGKSYFVKAFLQVFMLQGLLAVVVSFPTILAGVYGENQTLGTLSFLGVLVWSIGFYFEVVSDYQLDTFISDPKNKGLVLSDGLWKYSRHPNYFGEITMWWGVFLIALTVPNGIWALIGPLTITYLIIFVSGIPMLEKKYEGNKEYEKYKKRTSVLIPFQPKE